jgi:FkbM family methyltransferase
MTLRPLAQLLLNVYARRPKRPALTLEGAVDRHPIPRTGVLHLGANDGAEAHAYDRCGFRRVLWVEGVPQFYELLRRQIEPYPQQQAFNLLISDIDGEELTFHIADNRVSSTVLPVGREYHSAFPNITFVSRQTTRASRLDTYFGQQHIDLSGIEVLVVDLEGSELKALRSLGHWLHQMQYILIEISVADNYVNGPRMRDIDEFLVSHGYRRIETKMGSSSGDALYERRYARLADRIAMRASETFYTYVYYSLFRDRIVKTVKRWARPSGATTGATMHTSSQPND